MVDSVSVRFENTRVEKLPLNIRIQWNAGTACVLECVLKTLACWGLRVGPSKLGSYISNFGPFLRSSVRASTIKAVRGTFQLKLGRAIHGPIPV